MQTTDTAIEKLRVLTWHIHGTYLYYLTQTPCQWYVPVKPGRPAGYGGCGGSWPWGANVHEVPAEAVADLELDAVLFQSYQNFSEDQYQLLSPAQQQLPRLYLESYCRGDARNPCGRVTAHYSRFRREQIFAWCGGAERG